MCSSFVEYISKCYIRPTHEFGNSKTLYDLGPMDLAMLSSHYIQNGLLFLKPHPSSDNHQHFSAYKLVESLKNSLSLTLVHFYPLLGQLATKVDENKQHCMVYVDCDKGLGARFIHTSLHMTIDEILLPTDVPRVVESFFDHHGAINHDGHVQPLLSIQLTELLDGIFIGCSMNHTVADGASFWNFWNVWSAIHMTANINYVQLQPNIPVIANGQAGPIKLPVTFLDQFTTTTARNDDSPDQLRKRIFHFSSEAVKNLKVKANEESNIKEISSLQALLGLAWRSIAQANDLPLDHVTNLILVANNRRRLNPPLPEEYFGNQFNIIITSTKAGELHANNLGWIASLLHQSVVSYNDSVIRNLDKEWLESPCVPELDTMFNPSDISVTQSPRFEMYGNEFGLGKPIAVRSGFAHRFAGVVSAYPGYEGRGSIDLEICLSHDSMRNLESNEEFMDSVLTPRHLRNGKLQGSDAGSYCSSFHCMDRGLTQIITLL